MKNRIEIVTIDDEILVGNNKNFNLAWLGKCLSEKGFAVQQITTIPSNKSQIWSSVASAFNQADAVLLRFADDKFNENFYATIGVDFRFKNITIDNKSIKLQIVRKKLYFIF